MGDVAMDDAFIDATWWNATEKQRKPHELLVSLMETLRAQNGTLRENTRRCIATFQWGGLGAESGDDSDPEIQDTWNVHNALQNMAETIHAKVCKTRILPMALTAGAGYLERQRAKELSKAIEGEFDENEVDQIKEDVVMDALVSAHGAGAAKVTDLGGKVRIQHVPIEDVYFDRTETRYRKPRSMFHIQALDKFVVLKEYGGDDQDLYGDADERRSAILRSGNQRAAVLKLATGREIAAHQVEVYEAWHLPSGAIGHEEDEGEAEDVPPSSNGDGEYRTQGKRCGHDGRHVIAIDGCTLVDEPWDYDFFPILLFVPRKRRRSIWGLSLVFSNIGPQREYEKLSVKMQNAHQKLGMAGFTAPRSAKVNYREMQSGTLAAGFVVEHDGQQGPTPFVPSPVSPDTYAYHESIPRNMMERNGISTLSASSQLPAGLQQASGKALQVFEDFESERLLPYHRELERWIVSLAWLVVHTARRLAANDNGYATRYRGKRGFEKIDWAKVLVDKDECIIKVFPVSQLSKQPAAKFAQLTELLNAGAITVEQFKRLYELPDLEAESELDVADTEIIDRNLDIIVTTGRYLAPEPFDNLNLIIERAGKFYNLMRQYEVPEARLKLIRDFISDAKTLRDQQNAPTAPTAGAPPMGTAPGMDPNAVAPPGAPPPEPPPMPMAA